MATQPALTMPQITRILATTDFSSGADAALDWADRLARCFNAELILLHALDMSLGAIAGLPSDMAMVPAVEQLSERVREEAAAQMAQLAARYPHARTMIREGTPRAVILDVAREVDASLIVMGTHGRTGLAHVFFGSIAAHVVRHSRIPVLTVRHPAPAAEAA
jgi:nucleotide-binding universal stress UspA family protein